MSSDLESSPEIQDIRKRVEDFLTGLFIPTKRRSAAAATRLGPWSSPSSRPKRGT